MNRGIEFSKLSGSGNDFACIDNRNGDLDEILRYPERIEHFARALCRRGVGVGADGIVFACRPEVEGVAHVGARFLEPDGSESCLCGNGVACFVRWATLHGIVPDGEVKILTPAGVVRGQDLNDDYIRVCIPLPEDLRTDLELDVDGAKLTCDYVVTGVEHVVTYVSDVAKADLLRWGPALRNHDHFPQPRGVNVNFVQVLGVGEIAVRTYEYGVEAETLACGTGSAAAAILSARRFGWPEEYTRGQKAIRVRAPSGDTLRVHLEMEADGTVTDLCLHTLVRCSYTGTVCPDLVVMALRGPAGE